MKTNLICLFFFLGCFFGQTLADDDLQPLCDDVPENCPNGGVHVNTTANCSVCMPGYEGDVCVITEDGEDTCDEEYELYCQINGGSTGVCLEDDPGMINAVDSIPGSNGDSNPGSNGDSKPGSDDMVNVNIKVNIDN